MADDRWHYRIADDRIVFASKKAKARAKKAKRSMAPPRDLRSDFRNYFYDVFELAKETRLKTNRRKQMTGKKFFPLIFFAKSF
jgi:hypothetical protein